SCAWPTAGRPYPPGRGRSAQARCTMALHCGGYASRSHDTLAQRPGHERDVCIACANPDPAAVHSFAGSETLAIVDAQGIEGRHMKKILVADDDSTIADLLQQALEAEGYETYKATQSLRFYDAVIERQPDLILLDLLMPYLEGEDELRLLKMNETTKQIPVIVVT